VCSSDLEEAGKEAHGPPQAEEEYDINAVAGNRQIEVPHPRDFLP
jgi:hypothetical protein